MSGGIIALIARFRAAKKRPTGVIARLYYEVYVIRQYNIKENRLRTINLTKGRQNSSNALFLSVRSKQ